tara:strand:+ start:2382 stop:3431 length:1050 start_codon:yes stop_codon:yes gene_type:complete
MSNLTVTLAEVTKLIATTGSKVTVHMKGNPGIGKSSVLKTLAEQFPDYEPVYIDCADIDLGDIAMPVINHEQKSTAFYPNERFKLHLGKPTIIMLDEITKASEPVKNMLLPIMQERRLGSVELHPESIVFSTGNLTSDVVGDHMKAHVKNRVTQVVVAPPTAEEWTPWAIENNVPAEIIAWVSNFPHCMASYTDESQKENMYIYHPNKSQEAFTSARSLAQSGPIITNRDVLGPNATLCALSGTIGESAARDMYAYCTIADELPSRESVYSSPTTAQVPTDPSARVILVMRELVGLEEKNVEAWMTYLERLPMEIQGLFGFNIVNATNKNWINNHKCFTDWSLKNSKYF